MTQPTPTDPTEKALADSLGISRDDLKKMRRQILLPEEWSGGDGVPVIITEAGCLKIKEALKNAQKKEGGGIEPGEPGKEAGRAAVRGEGADNAYTPVVGSEGVEGAKATQESDASADGLPTLRVFEDLKVVALPVNKQLLMARTEDNKDVRVQVKSNALFKAGMKLEHCRKDGPCIYTYQGRMPRRKGKW